MQNELRDSRKPSDIEAELYFLIARFLSGGPCRNSFTALIEEVHQHGLLPKRHDWLGFEHQSDYDDLVRSHSHISLDHLLEACRRIGPMLDKEVRPSVSGVHSLLGAGRQSLLRTTNDVRKVSLPLSFLSARLHGAPLLAPNNLQKHPNTTQLLLSRELSGARLPQHQIPSKLYKSVQLFCRRLGHLSSVYCLLFDRTGRYIFTGADDLLVKIWSACDGRLLLTLRGHSAEITDMAVNYENTLLAAGSCDRIIRVWCLRTTTPVAVLTGHTGMITSLKFCPAPKGVDRYLISTGNDGCVFFWQWNVPTSKFNPQPRKFTERNRPGAQMQCSSFSPGGTFLATGSTDHHVRVYNVYGKNGPERILEVEAHSDRVDSIQFANYSERFVSGSKDGTANVWRFERQKWRKIPLRMTTRLPGTAPNDLDDTKIPKYRVTMVGWDTEDKYVVTAVNNHSLKVWNSHSGGLIYVLEGHDDEVFVLEPHPTDPRIFLSAGHDGRIILWDLSNGTMIKNFFNLIEGQGHGAVFDCKFAPDGRFFASTDSHGHLSIFGFGWTDRFRKIPEELFFHTDYRPLIRDANHHVLDEQTQQAPHLMPPPFLVNIDGDPYPPELQRLVPGRESCNDASLVPHVVNTGPGEIELFEAVRPTENDNRANIDAMIERLQRQQDAGRSPPPAPYGGDRGPLSPRSGRHASQSHSPSHGRVGIRRSGDVEGVRQSVGNWQSRVVPSQGELLPWSRRVAVETLDPGLLACYEERRRALSDAEIAHYRNEKKKRLDATPNSRDDEREGCDRKQGMKHSYRTRAMHEAGSRRKHTGDSDYEVAVNASTSSTSDTEDEMVWRSSGDSDSDSDSSEYSDWTQDAGVNLQPPKRSQAKSARELKVIPVVDDDEESNAPEEPAIKKRRSRRTKRRRDPDRLDSMSESRECPPEFRPSEWLTETMPHKAPYYPQMGDEVIYFQQGHKCYIEAVKRSKTYTINEKNQPWHRLILRDQELVLVVGIKYEIRPPRLCCLKLAMIDPETGRMTGQSFTIKYHDMPDVIDFLVIRQTYDLAMSRNWKAGDKFRSMIDYNWWVGTIVSQEPFEEEYPDSMFQCFNVHWDSKDKEKMSPWDFEPLDESRMPEEHGGGMAVLPDELKALLYKPKESEWPDDGPDEECNRIIHGLEQIMELSVAEPFIVPVDLNTYPSYARIVEYPIDLSVIRARLESRFYRRVTSVQFDVRFIEHNTKKFNEPGSRIVKQACMVTDLCLKFIADPTCSDVRPLYQAINSETVLHSDSSMNTSGIDSQDSSDDEITRRPSRKVVRYKKRKKRREYNSGSWKLQCKKFIDKVVMSGDAEPFLAPVDPLEYPDYREIIDTPMDLGTVKEQLLGENYESPIEFCKDMRLIFQNSRNYNINKKSKIYSMTIRLSALFEDRIRGIISDWKSAVKYEQKLKNNRYVSNRRRPVAPTRADLAPSTGRSAGRCQSQNSSHSSSRDSAGPSSSRSQTARKMTKLPRKRKAIKEDDEEEDDDDDEEEEEEDDKENRVQNGRTTKSSRLMPKRSRGSHVANGHVTRRGKGPLSKPRSKSRGRRVSDSDEEEDVDVGGKEDDDDEEEAGSEVEDDDDNEEVASGSEKEGNSDVKHRVDASEDGESESEEGEVDDKTGSVSEGGEGDSEQEEDVVDRRRTRQSAVVHTKRKTRVFKACQRNGKKTPDEAGNSDSSSDSDNSKSSSSSSSSSSGGQSSVSNSKKPTQSSKSKNSSSSSASSSSASGSDNSKSKSSDSSSDNGEKENCKEEVNSKRAVCKSDSESSENGGNKRGKRKIPMKRKQLKNRKKSKPGRRSCSRKGKSICGGKSSRSTSEGEAGNVRRSRRQSTRNSTKATRNAISSKHSNDRDSMPLRPKRRRSESEESYEPSSKRSSKRIATRSLGKRTVRYREDSDFEYGFDDSEDSDNSDSLRPVRISVSSKGRVRKLTPIAKGFIRR